MPQTFVRFDDGSTAQVTAFLDVGHTLYGFGQDLILVKPAYYGQPDRHAVTISLGRPGDKSGYGLTGLHIGDWFLTGTVMCTGYDFTPRTHPHAKGVNPLDDITDPDARQAAADHLSQIASHFHTTIAPGIKW
ncbi:hypothetical protein CLM85_12825 [Streptomyces albidoflavus]|uniref:hypothetical protein n=1 Tax=Streptomyces albidoflavus TaxID=1886 RepID=UPI000BAE22EA|nr:hypothetical protein [Streptomyces albidoflavus]PAX84303.1 hypothetical protein CLM81_17440 [Streptomyces albidoflavus]PAX88493.1 hypothetical protein CLM82_24080 [Streptomyces albidoflavus]PBO20352.1 hypothetical protein CLM83_01010 [Streptomyces albidoflavus]PBO23992.1 hypothetical protein CLM85_12825 [Streptomyces albidoflavus]PBO26501.1 hypothetical protein CLM84_31390 [Streptomyces albidoflavus]